VAGVRLGSPGETQYVPDNSPRARMVRCTSTEIIVALTDGRVLHTPIEWFDRLKAASPKARRRGTISFGGAFVHFPDAGEDISVERLLAPHCPACLARVWREHNRRTHRRAG